MRALKQELLRQQEEVHALKQELLRQQEQANQLVGEIKSFATSAREGGLALQAALQKLEQLEKTPKESAMTIKLDFWTVFFLSLWFMMSLIR